MNLKFMNNTKEIHGNRRAIFFSDLDNTLIYSHRHQISEPMVWVEELNGRHQSFMSRRSFDYFKTQDWLEVIPTTMRTVEQYTRLLGLGEALGWHLALVCNGAVLLVDGKEDPAWREESIRFSENDQPAYEATLGKAFDAYAKENIVSVDRIMFYIKGTEADLTYRYLKENSDPGHVFVYKDSRKVYCLPVSLRKGCAVRRFMGNTGGRSFCARTQGDEPFIKWIPGNVSTRVGSSDDGLRCVTSADDFSDKGVLCIAAGDGPSDVGMLEQADICLCPRELDDAVEHAGHKILCEGFFADSICRELENIRTGL